MLSRLFGRGQDQGGMATALYGAIVAQARSPDLYARLGVPDTVSGRFEMVILHAFLVFDRLQAGTAAQQAVGQGAFDLFCTDMDRSLRELGVGDLGVPRRMRQVGEAFYGRTRAYAECIARGDDTALAAALRRNVLKGTAGDEAAMAALTRYVRARRAFVRDRAGSGGSGAPVSRSGLVCGGRRAGPAMSGPVLSRPVAVAGIHGRLDVTVTADPQELAALAREYDLLGVGHLTATIVVTAGLDGAVFVEGNLDAAIEQACVVTLAPVAQKIDEAFALRFVRPGSPDVVEPKPHEEVVVDPAAPDPPEILTGSTIDVGAIVEEAFRPGHRPLPARSRRCAARDGRPMTMRATSHRPSRRLPRSGPSKE